LNINNVGDVNIYTSLITPIVNATLVNSNIVRVSDNIEIVGVPYSSVNILNLTNSKVLTFDDIKNGIITGFNSANGLSLTLPIGSAINSGMPTVGYGRGFQWSVINLASSTGNIIIFASSGHTYIGNATLNTNASYRVLTVLTAANTAITYRICN
jgi:hypothetical protein